jgi:hypothetical protein
MMKFHALLAQKILGNAQVLALAVAAQSNDVGMFAEEQEIGSRAGFTRSNEALLERRGFTVSNPSEIKRAAIFHGRQIFISVASLCYYGACALLGRFCSCR